MPLQYTYVVSTTGLKITTVNGDYVIYSSSYVPDVDTGATGSGIKKRRKKKHQIISPVSVEFFLDGITSTNVVAVFDLVGTVYSPITIEKYTIGSILINRIDKHYFTSGIIKNASQHTYRVYAKTLTTADFESNITGISLHSFNTGSVLEIVAKHYIKTYTFSLLGTKQMEFSTKSSVCGIRDIKKILMSLMNIE